jgi:hypothetical protein
MQIENFLDSSMELKFDLGRLSATPEALKEIPVATMQKAIARHHSGDWGEVDDHDRAANDAALIEGTRLFSVYSTPGGAKFWIITAADRSTTTILLPEDY